MMTLENWAQEPDLMEYIEYARREIDGPWISNFRRPTLRKNEQHRQMSFFSAQLYLLTAPAMLLGSHLSSSPRHRCPAQSRLREGPQ